MYGGKNVSTKIAPWLVMCPCRVICLAWKVGTSRKAVRLRDWLARTFARSFPPIFMLIHPVACVLLDMPIFFFHPPVGRDNILRT